MARYEIIDEPRTKPWGERLIVDPIIILFAAILVPLIWQPPLLGRFWMPVIWLIVNGYALGSSTLGKEIRTIVRGTLGWLGVLYGTLMIMKHASLPLSKEDIIQYTVIVQFGVFFLTLYLVVSRQAQGYELYKYMRGDDK